MDIVITSIPSGFWAQPKPQELNSSSGATLPELCLAIVFNFSAHGRSYAQLSPDDQAILDNWPKTVRTLAASKFRVAFQPDGGPTVSVDVAPELDDLRDNAWALAFAERPYVNCPATGSPVSKDAPITSFPASSVRQTLRHFYRHSMEGLMRPAPAISSTPLGGGTAVLWGLASLNIFSRDIGNNAIPERRGLLGGSAAAAGGGAAPASTPASAFIQERNIRRLADGRQHLQQEIVDFVERSSKYRVAERPRGGAGPLPDLGGLVQLAIFHQRVPKASQTVSHTPTRSGAGGAAAPSTSIDGNLDIFQRIAMAWNYPALLPPLGLMLRLRLPNEAGRFGVSGRLCVRPKSSIGQSFHCPWTRYDLSVSPETARWFRAQDLAGDFCKRGFLDFTSRYNDAPRFTLDNLDIDGTGLKMLHAAANAKKQEGAILYTSADDPFGAIIDQNQAALDLLMPKGTTSFVGRKLEDFVTTPNALRAYTRETLNRCAWNSVALQTTLNARDPSIVTALCGAAIRHEGVLYRIRWQLYAGAGYANSGQGEHLPAARSSGVGLIWSGRDKQVADKHQKAAALQEAVRTHALGATAEHDLYANDLTLGFVPEICSGDKNKDGFLIWRPLTLRHEEFQGALSGVAGISGDRDGIVRLPVAQSLDAPENYSPGAGPDLHVSEMILNWNGWQIGIGRPDGFQLEDEQSQAMKDKEALVNNLQRWKLPVEISPIKGSIVPLRFFKNNGPTYRLRVKTVNVAGLKPCDCDKNDGSALSIDYRRHEPVPPPELLLDEQISTKLPGRGLSRMVVSRTHSTDRRWCVPPRTSFEMAEKHGLLDVRSLKRIGGFDDVELREDGTFPLILSNSNRNNEIQNPSSANARFLPIRRPGGQGDRIQFPYYPDPLAIALVARLVYWASDEKGLPMRKRIENSISFYNGREWPKARAVRINLIASDAVFPRLESSSWEHAIEVHLPKGMTAELEIWSGLGEGKHAHAHLDGLALFDEFRWHDISRGGTLALRSNPDTDIDYPFALNKFVPLLRPSHTIECVHIVERPLSPARIEKVREAVDSPGRIPSVAREIGVAEAALTFDVKAEGQSTSLARMKVTWRVVDDDPVKAVPGVQFRSDDLGRLQVETNLGTGELPLLPFCVRHVMPDTAYRLVHYSLVGETRYREDYDMLSAEAGRLEGPPYSVELLNCGRPTFPSVDYVEPTFGWKAFHHTHVDQPRFSSVRKGGGLRVWLNRPWFQSGEGELLGVVLLSPSTDVDSNLRRQFSTQWGLDPLRSFQRLEKQQPYPDAFHGAAQVQDNIMLQELGRPVCVVGYTPTYCPKQRQWYCDLTVDPVPADYCFMRLALVRFQPKSISGMEVSAVVLADFAQLFPDRSVTVYRDPNDTKKLTLNVEVVGSPAPLIEPRKEGALPNYLCSEVQAEVYMQQEDDSWTIDPDIRVVPDMDPDRPSSWLWSGTLRWKEHVGPRRLVVTEYETITPAPEPIAEVAPRPASRIIYTDVLEL